MADPDKCDTATAWEVGSEVPPPPLTWVEMPIADKPTELSEQVLESVKSGQQAALEAPQVRRDRR